MFCGIFEQCYVCFQTKKKQCAYSIAIIILWWLLLARNTTNYKVFQSPLSIFYFMFCFFILCSFAAFLFCQVERNRHFTTQATSIVLILRFLLYVSIYGDSTFHTATYFLCFMSTAFVYTNKQSSYSSYLCLLLLLLLPFVIIFYPLLPSHFSILCLFQLTIYIYIYIREREREREKKERESTQCEIKHYKMSNFIIYYYYLQKSC